MQPPTAHHRPNTPVSPWLRRSGRLFLLGWVAFLTWFVVADMASEGLAKEPVLLLAALWTASATAWMAPRAGSVLLFAFAAAAAWIFRGAAGVVMLVLPAVVSGVLFSLSAPRRQVASTAGVLLASLLIGLLGGCSAPSGPPLELPFHTASITHHADLRIEKGLLAAPATIDGLPCKGWVRFWSDGRLRSCELAAATSVQGHELPAASYLWFDDQGRLQTCYLAQDTRLQGHLCRGGPFKIATSFHGNGALSAFFPRDELVIQGVRCADTTQAPVRLHPDGSLAACRLAEDVVIDGQLRRRGDRIELDATGHVAPGRN